MKLLPIISELKIVTKELGVVRFGDVLNWAQIDLIQTVERQLAARRPVRIIVLKARQIGISTVIEAICFVLAMVLNNLRVLIVAHELDASEHLLGITTGYWNSYPLRAAYTPKHASTKRLGWKETKSSIQISTAKNLAGGRSRTIHCLHGSEVAFWDDAETLMSGLRQAIPDTGISLIFLESTANGIGDFFQSTWDDAEDGTTDFVPKFYPWWKHPEYRASYLQIPHDEQSMGNLDAEERKLRRELGLDLDQLAWRRWAIRNKCTGRTDVQGTPLDIFHQEYPSSPEEAFLSSGTNVFPLEQLREVYRPQHGLKGRLVREGSKVRFQKDIYGPLTIFKYPAEDDFGIYMVAGDPTRTTRGDYACIQVMNRRTWEQVAVWRARIDPASMADEIAKLGRYYNNAMVNSEIEGPGYATIGALLALDYPYIWKHQWADKAPGKEADTYGWSTTHKRKQWMIGNLLKSVVDKDITIHDRVTFNEMKNYVTLPNGEYGPNSPSGYDDTVTSLAICLISIVTEAPTVPAYGTGDMARPLQPKQYELPQAPWEEWDEYPEGPIEEAG